MHTYTHEDDWMSLDATPSIMRVASCALRILDKCNIFRACWFIALTFSQPQKEKEKVGKLLTFQISRTKAKSNQTEWSNQYNKPTTCGAYFVVVTEETSIKENGAYTHIHTWLVCSFNASAIRSNILRSWHN